MKIAISSTGKDLNSMVDEVFGRCSYFLIVEIDKNEVREVETIENININQQSSAGISVAQMIASKNVGAVITGNVGPRALDVLKQFNILVYKGTGLISEVIKQFTEGILKETK
jgi:predicted Fe-Mo cluster-binding NifX family protein